MKKSYPTVRATIPLGIKLDENIYVTMRDGVKIAVDIYRPEAEGRYPALLSMSPYIKEIQLWPAALSHAIEAGNTNFAMIQYLVAAQQPPHLKCIAPFDGATDIYRDFCYQGGILFAWFVGMWGTEVLSTCNWPKSVKGRLPPANFIADVAANNEDGPYYWERSAIAKI